MTSRLVKLYPRAWRERFGDEFAELLAQERFRLGLVFDVVVGALDAHLVEMRRSRHMKRTLWLAFSFGIHVLIVAGAVYATTRQVEELPPPQLMIPVLIDRRGLWSPDSKIEERQHPKPTEKRHPVARAAPTTATLPLTETSPVVGDDHQGSNEVETGEVGGGDGTGGAGGGTGTDTDVGPAPERHIFVTPEIAHKISGDMPAYTRVAREAHVEGTIVAKICVDHAGTVTGVHILKSLPLLDDEVVRVVSSWRYQPFRYNGRPLPFCTPANFVFHLQ